MNQVNITFRQSDGTSRIKFWNFATPEGARNGYHSKLDLIKKYPTESVSIFLLESGEMTQSYSQNMGV